MTLEIRELQRIVEEARFSIGYIIDKWVLAIKESDQVLRTIFEVKQEDENTQLCLGVPVGFWDKVCAYRGESCYE